MDIEEDIKKLNKYIELVIDKDYCDCNELNVIIGKHCDGSKNVAYAIKNTLAEREEDKNELEEWQKAYQEEKDKQFDILRNSIPKQKIKDKIEELKQNIKNNKTRYPYILEHKIDILQELLEDK